MSYYCRWCGQEALTSAHLCPPAARELHKRTIPVCVREFILNDPHHTDHTVSIEWKYEGGKFYQRHTGNSKWNEVKRFHATPERVLMLAKLLENEGLVCQSI